jgi:cell division cycle protein 20 (cofactor of APC complex)
VKALAWCPFERRILASGGGSNDPSIKIWNTDSGILNNSINTESQICSLIWNRHDKELVSSHGVPNYQISVWNYPSLKHIGDLTGHTSKVLHMASSPDGTTVVSGAGGTDETLRFWQLFENKVKVEDFENFDYNYFNKNDKSKLNFQNNLR